MKLPITVNSSVLVILCLFLPELLSAQTDSVTITEVMFDPVGADTYDEFVEIYNYSSTQVYNLSGWKLSDSTGVDNIVDAGEGLVLYPGQFAVILDGDYSANSTTYNSLFPDSARILKVGTTDIGNSGLRNSPPETLYLITSLPDTISVYRYSGGSPNGKSDEKIILNNNNSASNWANALQAKGTPGNHAELILSINDYPMLFNPIQPPTGNSLQISAIVKNRGIAVASFFLVKFYEDTNGNLSPEIGEVIDSVRYISPLSRNDSAVVSITIPSISNGMHRYIAKLFGDSVLPYPDTTGANNVIIDSVETIPAFDVAVGPLSFFPAIPSAGGSLTISTYIKNTGINSVNSFRVDFYKDRNSNQLAENNELLDSVIFANSITAGDSALISVSDQSLVRGQFHYIAQIISSSLSPLPDERSLNNMVLGSIVVSPQRFSLIINEINYNSSNGSTEWVELYNRSHDTLDLKKWKIADGNSDLLDFSNTVKTITNNSYIISPGAFVIVGKDSNLFHSKYGHPSVQQFFISFPILNDNGDMIGLFDSIGTVIDSLLYDDSWGGGASISLERIIADSSSTNLSNWKSSEAPNGATPGLLNSQSPVDFDIAVRQNDIFFTPPHPAIGQPVTIAAMIRNRGVQNVVPGFTVKIYYDADANQTGDLLELLDSALITGLASGDSHLVTINWTVPSILSKRNAILAESRYIIVQVEYSGDQRIENNSTFQELKIGILSQSILINEILYEPDTSQVEFVEIYNYTNKSQNLQNWMIADASSSKIITPNPYYIPSLQFRVLTGDSIFFNKFPNIPDSLVIVVPSLPSLNNSDDKVVLKDDVGSVVDSLRYYNSWGGGNGKSMERKSYAAITNDPSNWVTCLSPSRSTPGIANSILQAQPYSRNVVLINEIMYSPFSGEPEYIEIYNPADTSVNLLNWSIQVDDSKSIIIADNFSLAPKDYVILGQNAQFPDRFEIPASRILLTESGLPTLSNSGNIVLLQDLVGNIVDSVNYSQNWGGGEGISIERIRPNGDANASDNWGSCVFIEGGTPGAINSNFAGSIQKKIKISSSPNPFLVDQGEQTKITIDIPVTQARITVKIYDNQGRLINTLLNNSLTGTHREIIWDGKDKSRSFARMGIYIIYVEVIDALSGFNKSAKETVVLGRKL